jgi:hypothetical protein
LVLDGEKFKETRATMQHFEYAGTQRPCIEVKRRSTMVVSLKQKHGLCHNGISYANVRDWFEDTINNVYVGRMMTIKISDSDDFVLPESPFANRYKVKEVKNLAEALKLYKAWFYSDDNKELRAQAVKELSGKTLGCWCVSKPTMLCTPLICHAQLLMDYVKSNQ